MNWIDGVTYLIIAVAALYGLLRGFIREFFGIICWVAAFYFAASLKPILTPALSTLLNIQPGSLPIISWGVAFAGLLIVFSITSSLLASRILVPLFGGFFNHILGAVIGGAKGVFVVCILYIIALGIISAENWALLAHDSQTVPYVQPYAVLLEKYSTNALQYLPGSGKASLPSPASPLSTPEGTQPSISL